MTIKRLEGENKMDSTDIALFVRVSKGDVVQWDRKSIVKALLRETDIAPETAERISIEAEETIIASKIKFITAPLIREVVNEKLIIHGLEEERKQHTRLGLAIFDVDQIITNHNKENANVPHGPEATNLSLAEAIKKQYALLKIFTPEVALGHECGDFHLHDL